ncbi:ATP-binding protein [Solemya velum gill symbiont]|uniref:ATP-binding protein n=1 Tax=Solemya velum gill symbiont TaxID=2340 RepID=UPI000998E53F|nr:hypothetical protein [Solemya velum gill symbiont]
MPHQQRIRTEQTCTYLAGIRQPGKILTLAINPLMTPHLVNFDKFLLDNFEVEPSGKQVIDAEKLNEQQHACTEVAWRLMILSRELLQAVRAPVFDPGKILAIKATQNQDGHYAVRIIVPWFDHISTIPLQRAYQAANRVFMAVAKNGTEPRNVALILQQLLDNFIKQTYKMVPGGESTVPVLANAHHKGIPFHHIGKGTYQLGWGKQARLVDRSAVDSDSVIGSRLSTNKGFTATLLEQAGLPAPQHIFVNNEQEAINAAQRIGWPVVIKPVDRERGEGIVVDIHDNNRLLHAYREAHKLSPGVLVEKQVAGVCHRIYVSNGEVLYANSRLAKSVTGDGIHTVAELIETANNTELKKLPWRRLKPCPSDQEALLSLKQAGFDMSSIPAEGERAPLRRIEATAWGGASDDHSDNIHPHNREIAIQAAELFGLDSAGIDLITPDVSVPWHNNGAIINEVNFAPLLGSHRTGFKLEGALAQFIENHVPGNGRIPVEVFVGKKSVPAAIDCKKSYVGKGIDCFMTSHIVNRYPTGDEIHIAAPNLFGKCRSLLMNRVVEALVIAIDSDEFLATGLPIDSINQLTIIDEEIAHAPETGEMENSDRFRQLLRLLQSYIVEPVQDNPE